MLKLDGRAKLRLMAAAAVTLALGLSPQLVKRNFDVMTCSRPARSDIVMVHRPSADDHAVRATRMPKCRCSAKLSSRTTPSR